MLTFTIRPRTTLLFWLLAFLFSRNSITTSRTSQQQQQQVQAIQLGSFLSNLFGDLLNPVVDVLARSTCQYIQSTSFNGDDRLLDYVNCDCSGSFNLANGMIVNTFCTLTEAICLDPDEKIFCGTTNVEANYRRRTSKLRTTACLEIDTGLQIEFDGERPQIPEICLTATSTVLAQRNLFSVDTCTINIASRNCRSCTVCDTGIAVKFDCGNIQLGSVIGNNIISGPVINECIGIGFILDNNPFNLVNDTTTSTNIP